MTIRITKGRTIIEIIQGDILALQVDAIVNPANRALSHGGGLAAQIVKKGGICIQDESDKLSPIETGATAVTTAGRLPCKFIIHAVGPVQGQGDEDEDFQKCIRNILRTANLHSMTSIAIPAISTGIFGYPTGKCAYYMKKILFMELEKGEKSLTKVTVCLYETEKFDIFLKEFQKE